MKPSAFYYFSRMLEVVNLILKLIPQACNNKMLFPLFLYMRFRMFDNVTLKLYDLPKNYNLLESVRVYHKSDVNTYKCSIKNMLLWRNYDGITIIGSLAKYLNDENITPLTKI
jgi:hypothetical protein